LRAARLAPRARDVRLALKRQPAPDLISARLTRVPPFRPAEILLAALVLWLLGWLVVGVSSRVRYALVLLVTSVAVGGYGGWVYRGGDRSVALVVAERTPLREAPFRAAPPVRDLGEGTAVIVTRVRGSWLLVRRGGQRGWLLIDEVALI
jgi:hypothetical protein